MSFIPNAITSRVGLATLKLSKHSPHILFGAGVVGVIGSAVLASRATLRIEEVLDNHQSYVEAFDYAVENNAGYSTDDRTKDLALLYVKTSVSITKLYGPALIVGGLAVAALTGSHTILTRRNASLAAAYAVIDKGFKEYRGRVKDDLGEEKDREYLKGIVKEKVQETAPDGKSVKVGEKKVQTSASPYGVLFNDDNRNWHPRPELNYMWLRGQQSYLNDKFQSQGYLFLSEVLDDLGFEQTKASRVAGWHKKAPGNNGFVDFGVFEDASSLRVHEYLTGRQGQLYLDFNVDGNIYDLI